MLGSYYNFKNLSALFLVQLKEDLYHPTLSMKNSSCIFSLIAFYSEFLTC